MTQQSGIFHPAYRADIDGLRAIAVVLVVGFHVFPNFIPGGFIGVDIFFVISGYLISTIIMRSAIDGRFSYRNFYERRVRRIFPALIAVLLAVLAAGWFLMMAEHYRQTAVHVVAGAGFFSNLQLWSEAGYFDSRSVLKPLLHLWSLGIEEQFYIAWPLIVGLIMRAGRAALPVLVALVVISLAACLWLTQDHAVAAYYAPMSRFWELAVGGILAYLHVRGIPTTRHISADVQAWAGLALLAVALAVTDKTQDFPGWRAILPVLASTLFISAGNAAWVNKNFLSLRAMVWVGLISYPLYLWHWPILSFTFLVDGGDKLAKPLRCGVVVVSFVLAWLTYRFVELPVRGAGRVRTRAIIAAMLAVVASAVVVWLSGGMPQRSVNQDPANRFLQQYKSFREERGQYYREECDFYDWATGGRKDALAPECTAAGTRATFFIWGDSHAQALSHGLRSLLPNGASLAQVATSGCRPALAHIPKNGADVQACQRANDFAVKEIKRLRPRVLFITQAGNFEHTDWREMATFAHENGARLVVVGPLPRWKPSLPEVVVKSHFGESFTYVSEGLSADLKRQDDLMRAAVDPVRDGFDYISVLSAFCTDQGCLAHVDTDDTLDLFAFDESHLTPAASRLVAQRLLAGYLRVD